MQTNHKISYIFIFLIAFGFVGGGWYFYQQLFQGVSEPMKIVPDDAAVIIEIPHFQSFYEKQNAESIYSRAFKELPYTQELSLWIPEFLKNLQKTSSNFDDWNSPNLIISVHPKGSLILFANSNMTLQDLKSEILTSLKTLPKISEKTIDNAYYLKVDFKNTTLFFSERKGVFMISNSTKVLKQAIENTKSFNTFTTSKEYISLQKVSGKRADAHIYVHYQFVKPAITSAMPSLTQQIWQQPSHIAGWTGLDLNMKPNEILLNGYTIQKDSAAEFIDIFKGQKNAGMTLPNNFPYQTENYQHISISKYSDFFESWKQFLKISHQWNVHQKDFERIEKGLKRNNKVNEKTWWAGEMAQLTTEDGKEYALFLAKKGRDCFKALSEVAHLSQPSMISMEYKGVKIKEINFPYYLYTQFGPWFSNFKKTYFTVVDELVIFSHQIKDLKIYIDLLEEGSILQKNEAYNDFSDNLSKNANYSFYSKNPAKSKKTLNIFPEKIKKQLASSLLIKKDLSSFSLQLSWKNKMFYTGVFVGLTGEKVKSTSKWQVHLDSPIAAGPFIVTDHTDASKKYLAFDEFKQIYMINQQGDIVWKKQLEEIPISDVFQVDYYHNGKIQYLFNTENYIYLIDLTGAMVKNYPLTLNSPATAGLSVFDYNSDKNYRIFIPAANGKIYNYKLDGSLLKGWKAKNTRRTIAKPIHHVVANSKDYIIAEADNGNILMLNRKGQIRLEIRKSFVNALGSDIYANRTNSKGMMVTTDQKGKFVYIPEKGKVKTSDFGAYSKDHFFLYTDFNGNGSEDFIFLDGKSLSVFDRFKHSILTYEFEHEIKNKPRLFTVLGRKVLGVVDTEAAYLYLFDYEGLMGAKIPSGKYYNITTDTFNQPTVLIGKGKSLLKYPLKQ